MCGELLKERIMLFKQSDYFDLIQKVQLDPHCGLRNVYVVLTLRDWCSRLLEAREISRERFWKTES